MLVRERIVAGDSDAAIRDYLTTRYGDFVLLKPPVKPATYLLWFGPPVLFVAAVLVIGLRLRRRGQPVAPPQLSAEERRRLDAILADGPGDEGGQIGRAHV